MRHSNFLHFWKLTAIIFCCLLATGCVHYIDEFTTIKPKESDLIGTWNATPDSLRDMRNRGHYGYVMPRIIIRADHTFTMENVPDRLLDKWDSSTYKLIAASGRWKLLKDAGGGWDISLLPHSDFSGATPMLTRNKPPYSLAFPLGDNFMEFEK